MHPLVPLISRSHNSKFCKN